jgi:hypothetical protein
MTAFKIITAAFRNIFADFGQTVRIFALPLLISAVTMGATVWLLLFLDAGPSWEIIAQIILPAGLVVTLCTLWSTINFHRYVLMGERFGWIPRAHWREMLIYGLMTIPMALMVVVVSYVMVWLTGRFGLAMMQLIGPMTFVILMTLMLQTIVTAIGLRLFSLLPGLAIGESLGSYSRDSRGSLGTILMIALTINVVAVGFGLVPFALIQSIFIWPTGFLIFLNAIRPVLNVFSTIFGISLLTALYAHYVQKRPAP